MTFKDLDLFVNVSEILVLVPALLGLKGNLEMTLASRLSTQVRIVLILHVFMHRAFMNLN